MWVGFVNVGIEYVVGGINFMFYLHFTLRFGMQ